MSDEKAVNLASSILCSKKKQKLDKERIYASHGSKTVKGDNIVKTFTDISWGRVKDVKCMSENTAEIDVCKNIPDELDDSCPGYHSHLQISSTEEKR